ncbi:MAG: hypothetical protein WKH64_17070 [Chloroflexia bacterium]
MVTPRIAVSIDIGTAKVCTLVVEHGADGAARLLGSGIARSRGEQRRTVEGRRSSGRRLGGDGENDQLHDRLGYTWAFG